MNLFFKSINYFFFKPFKKLIFYFSIKLNKKPFTYFFNFYSFLNRSKNKIFLKNNFFYNTEMDWRFFNKKQGIYSYGKGFRYRKNELKKVYLLENIEFKDNDIIIDIGANNGDFYLCFDKKIQYYGYEPSPVVFSNLKYNVKNQNLNNLALSNNIQTNVSFYISDEFGDSSILPISSYEKKIKINTTTLDEIISKINKKIKIIKIEAEGYEPEILEGLKQFMNYVEYITIDCSYERGVNEETTITACSNYLISNKFEMIEFNNIRPTVLFKNNNFFNT